MSLITNSVRSDHDSTSGLRSPLYGTATFTSLSPSSTPAPLSDSGVSSTRLSYPSRSVTPSTSDDGPRLRRVAISPTVSSYDSRRYTNSETYSDENDNSIDDAVEVEDALSRLEDELSQVSRSDNWSSARSGSEVSAAAKSATGSYTTATTGPLNFERERRSLSTISERTEAQSFASGSGVGTGIFHNLFSSTFSRPSSLFSSAARSLYATPSSPPLTPPPSIPAAARPVTPERTFKPAPPTGRRVGNIVASFESDISQSRPGSVPLGPRSPGPCSTSVSSLSRPTSPSKSSHTRSYTEGSYTHSRSYTDGGIPTSGHSQSASYSSYLSPPPASAALSRTTLSGSSETERPRSPLSSVRNIVSAWKERSPEKASTSTSQSVVSGPSYSSSGMSSAGLGLGFGGGIFSLRRRAATAASSRPYSASSARSYTDDHGSTTRTVSDSRSLTRSGSVRSIGGSSILDMSELDSFIRGSQDPLRSGQLWYLNVHAPPPFRWQRCRAILYPNTLLLTWLAPGGGRGVVTLDLVNCNEVRSVPSPNHVSARDDIGTVAAQLQMDERGGGVGDYDLMEILCPFQLLYSDGVERLGAESARERVRWVSAIWEALDHAVGPPDRSMTRSPTGSIRTIRSVASSVVTSGSGSVTTTYLPPSDTIPDLPEFDASTFTRSISPRNSLSGGSLSSYSLSRTRSSDDGAITSRGTLLHPLDARGIEIAPSRSSSLRRTSSLADLDAEFASVLRGSGITLESGSDTRTRSRGGSSRFSARWTREPSEYGASSTISPSESASAAGVTRRVRASTFYTLSEPTFTGSLSESRSSATEIVPSSLSLRGPGSASLLGDSHSGPTTAEESEHLRSPTTPTRSRSPETLYTSTSGLSRASAVRRRTPRSARTYSRSGPTTASTSDKENENDEPSQWSSLQGSYTTTSYEYSDYITRTRASSEPGRSTAPLTPRRAVVDPIEQRQERLRAQKPESESDGEFLTPIASRSVSSYHSIPGTPTPSSKSLPSSEYETAMKASSSTEFATAEAWSSEPSSTEYVTAEVCPSTPPATETEYFTGQCQCKPAGPRGSDGVSSLTPSLSLTSLSDEKRPIVSDAVSLYTPSEVPTIPSVIEEAAIPLPESESEESPPLSSVELEKSVSADAPMTPSSESSTVPTPTIEPPTPSSVTETSTITTTSMTSSSITSTPGPSIPLTPSVPSSPTSLTYKSESSMTPKSRSLNVPSHSSVKSSPSVSEYESSIFAASPSIHSMPLQEGIDASFETSFLRPGGSELPSDQASPLLLKELGVSAVSSTVTPTSTTTNTTSSLSQTPTVTRTWGATPSSVTTASSLPPASDRTPTISALTPSTALLNVPSARSVSRSGSATPSSLTPSSFISRSREGSSVPYTDVSSLTPTSPFEDESILGRTVTVSRTPSSVSSVSTTSMRSSIFAPTVYDDAAESVATMPTLLSSRATTPRPGTPRGVPLPSSPSLSMTTATPSGSISTPRSDARSLRTQTSVATSSLAEAPREEILTHDVNRLLRYLHDLDQIRGGETADMKDHLQRIEDELRDLADFLRKPTQSRSVGSSAPISDPRAAAERAASLEYVSPMSQATPVGQRPSATSGSTAPLPVPEPRGAITPSVRSLTPPPQMLTASVSYSPSTVSEDLSLLTSPHSDDFSLMSLEDYPAVPISPPGSPSSPSDGSGWPSSSSGAPWPPSSVTPSSVPQSTLPPIFEDVSDLTLESPLPAATPIPVPMASPLASLASTESALPYPPASVTPSLDRAVTIPLPISPMPAGPYGRSPLQASFESSSERSSLSFATPPPSSSMPSSSSAPSLSRGAPSVGEFRQPASPVLSMTEVSEPEGPPRSAILGATPTPDMRGETPVLPMQMPTPDLVTVPPSPSSIHTVRPGSDRGAIPRELDDLRDLLQDLRGQAQALWNGQQDTNNMLDQLRTMRPTAATPPAEEVANRLRNIEGLLDGILRDLARGGLGPEEPASEISSDTSSALRRYIDRLRDRRHEPLHMPTPVRAPPQNLDSEWLEFLSEPPPITEPPIQGPPPLVPLYRRTMRRHRETSMSPPLDFETPIRIGSAPLEERIPLAFSPPLTSMRDPRRQPWMSPRLRQGVRPRESLADTGRTPVDFERWPRHARREHRRQPTEADIDMLRELERLRRQRRGGDGRYDATVPLEEQSPEFEMVPPPPRVHTAPPTEHAEGWYRPTQIRPGQTLGDAGTVPTPAAPPPQPFPGGISGMPMPGGVPIGIPMGGHPPPFNEMLDLLRQNRLAQTASIDQQREIMRYMRGLNQWLEHDVRDRHRELSSIAARVDALRNELGRLVPGGGPVPFPQAMPGQPQGPPGQTFIVPPMPGGQPFMPPGGPAVMPSMPIPQMPFTPGGSGPPVIPPYPDGGRTGSAFIPPRPGMAGVPVIPDLSGYARPGDMMRPPRSRYSDEGSGYVEPFIPPRPAPTPGPGPGPGMIPVPPPGQQFTVVPPLRVESSSPRSGSSGSYSPRRHEIPDITINVPSRQHSPQPPPQVVRVDDQGGRVPTGPLHPDLAGSYQPTVLPQAPSQQPIIIQQPQPPPTFPSGYPQEAPTQPIILHSDRPYSPSRRGPEGPVVVVPPSRGTYRSRSGSRSPTRVVVQHTGSRRSYRERSPDSRRLHRTHTGPSEYSDRPRRHRRSTSRSMSPSPRRRRDRRRDSREYDRGRSRSRSRSRTPPPVIIRTEGGRTHSPVPQPVLIQQPQQQPQFISTMPDRRRSRSSSRSSRRTPVFMQHPSSQAPPVMLGDPSQQPQQPIVITQPSQVPIPVHPPTGYPEGRTRYSPSPPPHVPTMVPTVIHAPPMVAPSGYERDRPRSRSPSYEGDRPHSRSPRYEGDRRRSRSPRYEGDRRRSRSPRYEGDRRRSRSPRYEGDRRRSRSPRSTSPRDEGGRRLRRHPRSRSYSPRDARRYGDGDRDGDRRRRRSPEYEDEGGRRRRRRSPSYEDTHRIRRSRSPRYYESDRPSRREYSPSTHRPPTAVHYSPRAPTERAEFEQPVVRSESPTRVVVQTRRRSPTPERVVIGPSVPPAASYAVPESEYAPPSQVVRIPTSEARRPVRPPSREEAAPTVIRMDSGRVPPTTTHPEDYLEAPISIAPSGGYVPSAEGRPVRAPSPRTAIHSAIHGAADSEPVYPIVHSRVPTRVPTGISAEPVYEHEERVPQVVRTHRTRRSPDIYEPHTPSGPGDLALHDELRARQERLDEHEQRLEALEREAEDAEDRREQFFREHEDERERIFQDNEDRRLREAAAIHDEVAHALEELPRPPLVPPPMEQAAVPVGAPSIGPAIGGVEAIVPEGESLHYSDGASITSGAIPVPPPMAAVSTGAAMPQLQEILDLLRAQQTENAQCKAEQAERFDIMRDEIADARAEAKAECEERIRMLEDELARAREELEQEREQRRAEDLERIEREHADVIDRDEAVRAQLGDITNIVQEQRDELVRKRELMDERWEEKQARREQKQARNDAVYEMLDRIIQEREQERREREMDRAAAAERPGIERVLEELRRQNEAQTQLINDLTAAWRDSSARQHQETIEAVQASAREMVPYNLTGYLDEFSKALAGEIRTLLGEVGRLHEQKRSLQFEIGSLFHMYTQYGPGGQFEPDWRPTMGPLAPPPPGGDMPGGPGGPPPPPGPEEPPPPARPAWRTVQQRAPRRKRTGKSEMQPPPASTLAPPEPIPHPPSWATWQPNPAFEPSPLPPGASPLVVPPSGPTGLFGPRSPRGTMYGG